MTFIRTCEVDERTEQLESQLANPKAIVTAGCLYVVSPYGTTSTVAIKSNLQVSLHRALMVPILESYEYLFAVAGNLSSIGQR